VAAARHIAVVEHDHRCARAEPATQPVQEPQQVGAENVRPEEAHERGVELPRHPVKLVGIGGQEGDPAWVLAGAGDLDGRGIDVGGRDRRGGGSEGTRPVSGACRHLNHPGTADHRRQQAVQPRQVGLTLGLGVDGVVFGSALTVVLSELVHTTPLLP
jgi:hypothetical protein